MPRAHRCPHPPRARPTAVLTVRAPRAHAVAHPPCAVAHPLRTRLARPTFRRPQPRRLCAVCSRNASVLPNVSRETFVPISHYIATIVSRETIPTSAKTANERRAPAERRRPRRTQLRSERGLFSRSIFQTATTARPCGKAVAAFPLVVKATVEAGQVGWKACAAKRSVLVELR